MVGLESWGLFGAVRDTHCIGGVHNCRMTDDMIHGFSLAQGTNITRLYLQFGACILILILNQEEWVIHWCLYYKATDYNIRHFGNHARGAVVILKVRERDFDY